MKFDDKPIREKIVQVLAEIVVIGIALHFFHSTDAINGNGEYALAINAIAFARILCLPFALSRVPKVFEILFRK